MNLLKNFWAIFKIEDEMERDFGENGRLNGLNIQEIRESCNAI